jgi:glycine/D-amino acid oxidase-like deaminating enzyme
MKNYSPWLYQLRKDRTSQGLHKDISTDIAIIGAGIAGISTAFFTLKNTDKKVVLIEGYKLAHGATGHNAGQIVSYFERGFASLVNEFGLELATQGQKAVEDAWMLFDEMYADASLDIPFSKFLGHAGLSSYEQVMLHLKNNFYRKQGGLETERMLISEDATFLDCLPEKYHSLYEVVPDKVVLETLETKDKNFVAVLSYPKGCVNSALFCEEVLLYLLHTYPERFSLYEHTKINKVILKNNHAILDAAEHTIIAHRVVLCTNGFANITIFNETGLDIDTKFHHLIHGTVGYMSGYLEQKNKEPIAISYLTDPNPNTEEPYFYLTRRPYEYEGSNEHNLISIGGPELSLDDARAYSHESEYPDAITEKIDDFVKHFYDPDPNKKIDYKFTWHGLMGYTRNGIRLVGIEPKNDVLLYNLGCNGIGILPSMYGGKRVAEILAGTKVEKSIFDVPKEYK